MTFDFVSDFLNITLDDCLYFRRQGPVERCRKSCLKYKTEAQADDQRSCQKLVHHDGQVAYALARCVMHGICDSGGSANNAKLADAFHA